MCERHQSVAFHMPTSGDLAHMLPDRELNQRPLGHSWHSIHWATPFGLQIYFVCILRKIQTSDNAWLILPHKTPALEYGQGEDWDEGLWSRGYNGRCFRNRVECLEKWLETEDTVVCLLFLLASVVYLVVNSGEVSYFSFLTFLLFFPCFPALFRNRNIFAFLYWFFIEFLFPYLQ